MLTLRAYDKPAPAEFVVAGGHGKAFMVGRGQFLTITDVRGQQVGDFFAWNRHDPREYLSPHNTRLTANALVPPVGSRFVTNRRRPMFVLVRDTVGRHDLLMAACDPARYASFGVPDHRSCAGNVEEALRELGIRVPRVYDPVNLFMNVPVAADGSLAIEPPLSRAGDVVTFRATMDTLCALSACPMDLNACNGGTITELRVRVHDEADWL
jgi:uncharacterized protein YcgI (DUF1989 family)